MQLKKKRERKQIKPKYQEMNLKFEIAKYYIHTFPDANIQRLVNVDEGVVNSMQRKSFGDTFYKLGLAFFKKQNEKNISNENKPSV